MTFNPQVGDRVRIVNFSTHTDAYTKAGYLIGDIYEVKHVYQNDNFGHVLESSTGKRFCFPLASLSKPSVVRRS